MVYFCEACNFNTKIKSHFEKHLKTSKHVRKVQIPPVEEPITPESIPEETIPEESIPEESIPSNSLPEEAIPEYEDSEEYSIPYISVIYNRIGHFFLYFWILG